jgi:hypothetical protein
MTIPEWWLEYELNAPKDPKEKFAGKLTRADVEELKELLHGSG